MRSFARTLIGLLVLAVTIFFLIRLVVGSYSITGQSMQPGLQTGEVILVNKTAYDFNDPARGEIICCRSPEDNHVQLRRVIGIPGDVVQIKNNAVYLNGVKLKEPYVSGPTSYTLPSFQVPADEYFVLADNRSNANKSSTDWTIPQDNVIGRAWLIVWPADLWGTIDSYPLGSELSSANLGVP